MFGLGQKLVLESFQLHLVGRFFQKVFIFFFFTKIELSPAIRIIMKDVQRK